MAKVASWSGQPLEACSGSIGVEPHRPSARICETWDEYVELVHPDDRSKVRIMPGVRGVQAAAWMWNIVWLIDGRQIDIHAVARFDLVGPLRFCVPLA